MTTEKEKIAPDASVGADDGRSIHKTSIDSITETEDKINDFEEDYDYFDEDFLLEMLPSHLKTVSLKELYSTVYQSKPPIIDGLLHCGTYIFAGAPKLGKSFLMAQLAFHVSSGSPLWGYPVRSGTVLYLALEDDYRRLQERLYRMFGVSENDRLFFSVSAGTLGGELDEQLRGFVDEHPDTNLVIIDTLQRVRDAGGNDYSYSNDYQIITRLKSFADARGLCLILVHHTRKQHSDDRFDMISGTNGLLGAADGGFVLQKEKRTSNQAILDISGRDQQDQRLHLVRNQTTLAWELDRAETELWKESPEPLLEAVSAFVSSVGDKWTGSPSELCERLNLDMKANVMTQKLNINAARLMREYGIRYTNHRSHSGRRIALLTEQA